MRLQPQSSASRRRTWAKLIMCLCKFAQFTKTHCRHTFARHEITVQGHQDCEEVNLAALPSFTSLLGQMLTLLYSRMAFQTASRITRPLFSWLRSKTSRGHQHGFSIILYTCQGYVISSLRLHSGEKTFQQGRDTTHCGQVHLGNLLQEALR